VNTRVGAAGIGVDFAHLATAENKLTIPMSLGFSSPRFNLFFITDTNSLLERTPSPSSSKMVN